MAKPGYRNTTWDNLKLSLRGGQIEHLTSHPVAVVACGVSAARTCAGDVRHGPGGKTDRAAGRTARQGGPRGAADRAAFITGHVLSVSGGLTRAG